MRKKPNTEDKLFSKFSHDLRGSFVSILGYTELLNDPTENISGKEVEEFIGRIDFRTKETYDLLDNFINWLKLERYNDKLLIEYNSLFDSILEAEFNFNNLLKEKNINLIKNINGISKVFIDLQILRGIIKNIFLFILKNIEPESILKISYIDYNNNVLIKFEFISDIDEHSKKALLRLNDKDFDILNIPNEILFVKKFVELSKGKFDLFSNENFKTEIIISLPKK